MAPSPAPRADATPGTGLAAAAVDTVVVGSGPSALLLSWILHGHHPYIRFGATHPDPQLQAKLSKLSAVFDADPAALSAHFPASRLSYSTQALPVNTLLDTLLRPQADTAPGAHASCIEWRYRPAAAVQHLVLGAEDRPGGQWQAECVAASGDIGALSYADLVSLPAYSLANHLVRAGKHLPSHEDLLLRPSRDDVASYLASWPAEVGISDSLRLGRAVSCVSRAAGGGFVVEPHGIHCRRLVLATGIFSHRVPPRPLLRPLLGLRPPPELAAELPLLVVGSGFSAADLILTHLPRRRPVLHIFQWDARGSASPLRACHPAAYPEYAAVFRRMKRAALKAQNASASVDGPEHSVKRRKSSAAADALLAAEEDALYEGLPNTLIHAVHVRDGGTWASVILQRPGGGLTERPVCGLEYVVGRRGSLDYLAPPLRSEVLGGAIPPGGDISAKSLRARAEELPALNLAPSVFVVGSLLGDSLIRHAYGGAVVVAGELTRHQDNAVLQDGARLEESVSVAPHVKGVGGEAASETVGLDSGYDSAEEVYDGTATAQTDKEGHDTALLMRHPPREANIKGTCTV